MNKEERSPSNDVASISETKPPKYSSKHSSTKRNECKRFVAKNQLSSKISPVKSEKTVTKTMKKVVKPSKVSSKQVKTGASSSGTKRFSPKAKHNAKTVVRQVPMKLSQKSDAAPSSNSKAPVRVCKMIVYKLRKSPASNTTSIPTKVIQKNVVKKEHSGSELKLYKDLNKKIQELEFEIKFHKKEAEFPFLSQTPKGSSMSKFAALTKKITKLEKKLSKEEQARGDSSEEETRTEKKNSFPSEIQEAITSGKEDDSVAKDSPVELEIASPSKASALFKDNNSIPDIQPSSDQIEGGKREEAAEKETNPNKPLVFEDKKEAIKAFKMLRRATDSSNNVLGIRGFSPATPLEALRGRSCKKAAKTFIHDVCLTSKRRISKRVSPTFTVQVQDPLRPGKYIRIKGEEKEIGFLQNANLSPVVNLGERVPDLENLKMIILEMIRKRMTCLIEDMLHSEKEPQQEFPLVDRKILCDEAKIGEYDIDEKKLPIIMPEFAQEDDLDKASSSQAKTPPKQRKSRRNGGR